MKFFRWNSAKNEALNHHPRPKTTPERVLRMRSYMENAKILFAAKADPDAQPMTKKQLAAMMPPKSVPGWRKSDNKIQLEVADTVCAHHRES